VPAEPERVGDGGGDLVLLLLARAAVDPGDLREYKKMRDRKKRRSKRFRGSL
jgi:hypothetical protein